MKEVLYILGLIGIDSTFLACIPEIMEYMHVRSVKELVRIIIIEPLTLYQNILQAVEQLELFPGDMHEILKEEEDVAYLLIWQLKVLQAYLDVNHEVPYDPTTLEYGSKVIFDFFIRVFGQSYPLFSDSNNRVIGNILTEVTNYPLWVGFQCPYIYSNGTVSYEHIH